MSQKSVKMSKNPSRLEILVSEAEDLSSEIEFDKIREMQEAMENIQNMNCFDDEEIEELQKSYAFHVGLQREKVQLIKERIEEAKTIWQEKLGFMENLWRKSVIDDGVSNKWNEKMKYFEERISKLSASLSMWD